MRTGMCWRRTAKPVLTCFTRLRSRALRRATEAGGSGPRLFFKLGRLLWAGWSGTGAVSRTGRFCGKRLLKLLRTVDLWRMGEDAADDVSGFASNKLSAGGLMLLWWLKEGWRMLNFAELILVLQERVCATDSAAIGWRSVLMMDTHKNGSPLRRAAGNNRWDLYSKLPISLSFSPTGWEGGVHVKRGGEWGVRRRRRHANAWNTFRHLSFSPSPSSSEFAPFNLEQEGGQKKKENPLHSIACMEIVYLSKSSSSLPPLWGRSYRHQFNGECRAWQKRGFK